VNVGNQGIRILFLISPSFPAASRSGTATRITSQPASSRRRSGPPWRIHCGIGLGHGLNDDGGSAPYGHRTDKNPACGITG